jgi:hypothetical protein
MFTVKTAAEWLKSGNTGLASLVSACGYLGYTNICGDDAGSPGWVGTGSNFMVRLNWHSTFGWTVDMFTYGVEYACYGTESVVMAHPYVSITVGCGNAGNTVSDVRNIDLCNPQGIYECGLPPFSWPFDRCEQDLHSPSIVVQYRDVYGEGTSTQFLRHDPYDGTPARCSEANITATVSF